MIEFLLLSSKYKLKHIQRHRGVALLLLFFCRRRRRRRWFDCDQCGSRRVVVTPRNNAYTLLIRWRDA